LNRFSYESKGLSTSTLIRFTPIKGLAVGQITRYARIEPTATPLFCII